MDHPQPTADDEDDQLDHHHHHHHHHQQQQQQQQSRESQPPSPSSSTSSSPSKKQHSQSHFRREPSFSRWCGDDDNGSKIHQLHLQPVPTTYAYGLGHTPTNSFDGAISIPDSDPDPDPFSLCYPSDDNDVIADHDHDHHYDSSAHHRGGHYFRQRSPANDSRVAFDIESGTASATLHTSQSRAKLDSLENISLSPLHLAPLSPSSDAGAVFKTALCIFIWYTISTCLTLYNKSLLGDKLGKFPAPLLMNTFHFAMQAVLSRVIGCFQVPRSTETSVPMTWRDYFVKVVPTAIGTALDVNLSNASLVFITVTFATMCKSASPIFLLLFAFAFRLESPSIKLLGIILVISVGVLLTVSRETDFDFWGFVFVMLAAVMSGFRWSMTQILLQKEAYGLKNPITLMSYIAPVMTLMTASLSLLLDPWHEFHNNVYFNNLWHTMRSCLLMLIGGSLAFFMVLTEYILVSATSAVTVTIAGVVKEAVTILVAVFYFHEQFTLLKGVGLITIMIGVSLFNWYKYHKQKKGQLNEHGEPMSPSASMTTKYVILDETDSQEDDT